MPRLRHKTEKHSTQMQQHSADVYSSSHQTWQQGDAKADVIQADLLSRWFALCFGARVTVMGMVPSELHHPLQV